MIIILILIVHLPGVIFKDFLVEYLSLSTTVASVSISRHTATTLAAADIDAAITITIVLRLVVAGEGLCNEIYVYKSEKKIVCQILNFLLIMHSQNECASKFLNSMYTCTCI